MNARWLQIKQYRCFATHAIQSFQIDLKAHATGDCRQVNNSVCRATDCEQHAHCIFKGFLCQDLINAQAFTCDLDRQRSALFSNPHTVCSHCGWSRTTRYSHAESFCNTSHRAGSTHHRTGAYAGDELSVDLGYFLCVDFLCAEFAPVAAAVCAGAHSLAAMRARQHGACDELHGWQSGRCRAH